MLVAYAGPLLSRLGGIFLPNESVDRQAELQTYMLSTVSWNLDHKSFG